MREKDLACEIVEKDSMSHAAPGNAGHSPGRRCVKPDAKLNKPLQ
jgi:hypothetical protein